MRILIFLMFLAGNIFAQSPVVKEIPMKYFYFTDRTDSANYAKVVSVADSTMFKLKNTGMVMRADTIYTRKIKTKKTRLYNVDFGNLDSSGTFVPVATGSWYIEGEDDTPFKLKKAEIDSINGN